MFETSKDILNLLIGVSVFLVAAMLSWVLYQMGTMIKNINQTMSAVQNMIQSVNDLVNKLKDKASVAGSYFTVLVKSAQQVMEFLSKNKKTSSGKKNK